jgi:hypothetical protein
MSTISLNLPEPLHDRIREIAQRDGISVEQFLETAVAEKLASHAYVRARARRSTQKAFERALAQVPDVPPIPGDEI